MTDQANIAAKITRYAEQNGGEVTDTLFVLYTACGVLCLLLTSINAAFFLMAYHIMAFAIIDMLPDDSNASFISTMTLGGPLIIEVLLMYILAAGTTYALSNILRVSRRNRHTLRPPYNNKGEITRISLPIELYTKK